MRRPARRRYKRYEGVDLFRGLGPGDPGYRLRPGASGLDPMETYMEQGRVIGLLFKSLLEGGPRRYLVPSLIVVFAGAAWASLRILSSFDYHFVQIHISLLLPFALVTLLVLVALLRTLRCRA